MANTNTGSDYTLDFTGSQVQGLLEDVQKIKEGSVSAYDAKHINDLEIKKDLNGVLKIGNIVIPQRESIWSNSEGAPVAEIEGYTISDLMLSVGDTIEIISGITTYSSRIIIKIRIDSNSQNFSIISNHTTLDGGEGMKIYSCLGSVSVSNGVATIRFSDPCLCSSSGGVSGIGISRVNVFKIFDIVKIIE